MKKKKWLFWLQGDILAGPGSGGVYRNARWLWESDLLNAVFVPRLARGLWPIVEVPQLGVALSDCSEY